MANEAFFPVITLRIRRAMRANVRLEFASCQTWSYALRAGNYGGICYVRTVFELTVLQKAVVSVAPVYSVMGGISAGRVAYLLPSVTGTGFGQRESPAMVKSLVQ